MAWISVHEDVVGPKLRKLVKYSELSRNEALGTLIVLWLWGIKNADPNGLIKSADRGDVADVISSGLSEGADAAKVVDCMVEAGWIDDCDGELYLHDWDEWQEMWYTYLGRKEKDTIRKRKAREKERMSEDSNAGGKTPSEPLPLAPPKPQKPPKPKKEKPEKVEYAEFVHMQESEYQKLVGKFGQGAAEKMVEILDNYKGANKKKYDDDYRAILNWVVDRAREKHPGLIESQEQPADNGNPFKEWGGADEQP